MDAVVYGALEEICSQGVKGLTLRDLWSKIHSHLSFNGLNLCTNVKKALWSNLLNIPSTRFECKGVSYDAEDPKIQSVEDAEAMELRIVAAEHLLDSFVGIYDIKASDASISPPQRRALERLAIARTDGVTQNDIAKEFGIKNNNIYYVLKNLESRGLIVRQSTIVRKKEAGNEGEYKAGSVVNTNMLHLYRYAMHLGSLQRLEITKEDKAFTDNENADREVTTGDGVYEEHNKEDVHVRDYVPALKAICDRLEKADGKVLVVSDIKRDLGYRKSTGHRAWRNMLHRLKDANLVEEFYATVNNKEVSCLRLLKKFSFETGVSKCHGGGDDDLDTEQPVKLVKRGQTTDQLLELPIEQQIYDMIDAEGSKGLIINEVYKRLGINNKQYYDRILDMVSRFQMNLASENLNRGKVYRVSTTPPGKSEDTMNEKVPTHAQAGQLMLSNTIQESDHVTSKIDAEPNEEHNITPIQSGFIDDASRSISCNDTLLDSRSSLNLQCDTNGVTPDAELQVVNVKTASNSLSLVISSSSSPPAAPPPPPKRRRSYTTYPCLSSNSVSSQREQRILEKLEEEKVLLKSELHRLIECLENLEKKHEQKHTMMDRKTLKRSLNKLQEEGHCKIISFAFPSVTNCGNRRTVDVILHPSVYKAQDLSERVHERIRSFEKLSRAQCVPQRNRGESIPVLDNVERINVKKDLQSDTFEAMKNNGFVLSKMVRAKLLHVFLWGYLTRSPGWDDTISEKHGNEQNNPHTTCKLFELDAAIKAMPLELFLQVAGSPYKLDSMIEKCKNGLCLCDLPLEEYRCLMDTRATARLSYLIDILRRLKLIRLIGEELTETRVGPHTTLRHSLELKPYIEEPVTMVLPSTGVNCSDLRPHVRHDFVLATRKGVDEYWNTLEYSYAASDPKAALHAFPGTAVHEVFLSRAWASVRVMTAHQRAELLKFVANDDSSQKLSYKKCEKIAEKLNLTLEQVLRVFYDKRQKLKLKAKEQKFQQPTHALITYKRKRKRSSKENSVNNENPLNQEDKGIHMLVDEIDAQNDIDPIEDEENHSYSAIHECALSKLQHSARGKRFAWSEKTDRLLVIEYVKHRAVLGAKFHRAEWASLQSVLPAPPDTCRRRMTILKRNNQFNKALMKLCNILSVRYTKHLENSKNNGDDLRMIIWDQSQTPPDLIDDANIEEKWDDFDNKDIKIVLDEILQYKQVAKMEATKDARYVSKYTRSDEFGKTTFGSPSNELKNDSERRKLSTRRSRRRLPKAYDRIINRGKGFATESCKSLAVSNAIELFKLIFLSTAKASPVPNLLAETLRRYSEHDLFTAFDYLRERKFMVRGNDISRFVLSQQFLHNISSSPFPVNTGKRAVKMGRWVHEREEELLENGVNLSADLQCGDVLQLCVLMCSGELSIYPCLPDEGVGEIKDLKKRKCDDENEVCRVEKVKKPKLLDSETFSRREKGFPGIKLSLNRSLISRNDAITFSGDGSSRKNSFTGCNLDKKLSTSGESTWEAMTCYAKHMASSGQQEVLSPNLFKTVHSAIQKAGDQGLNIQEISQIIDVQEEKIPELIIEVLETFGRALKVNAYDSIHVVDSLYRSKYLLTSLASHPQDLDKDGEPLLQEKGKQIMKETSPDFLEAAELIQKETCTSDGVHRVTILNHPEEIPQPLSHDTQMIETSRTEATTEERTEEHKFCMDDSPCYKPILPWVNGDGSINKIVYKGLVRRVLGIIMQNPGILEEHILKQMNVLNPQSCRKLLEIMILESHITVRKMYEAVSNAPPTMLLGLIGGSFKKPEMVCKEHLFANPRSINCL